MRGAVRMFAPQFEAQGHLGVSTFMPVPGAYRLVALCESSLLPYPDALLCAGQGWAHSSDHSPSPTLQGAPSSEGGGYAQRGQVWSKPPDRLRPGRGEEMADLRGCQWDAVPAQVLGPREKLGFLASVPGARQLQGGRTGSELSLERPLLGGRSA